MNNKKRMTQLGKSCANHRLWPALLFAGRPMSFWFVFLSSALPAILRWTAPSLKVATANCQNWCCQFASKAVRVWSDQSHSIPKRAKREQSTGHAISVIYLVITFIVQYMFTHSSIFSQYLYILYLASAVCRVCQVSLRRSLPKVAPNRRWRPRSGARADRCHPHRGNRTRPDNCLYAIGSCHVKGNCWQICVYIYICTIHGNNS